MGITIDKMFIGQQCTHTKTISETDVYLFAGITGDFNPIHVDAEYAKETRFGARIAHGVLTLGLISACIAMQIPGPGTIYLGQDLKFLAPVHIGDTITAICEVSELDTEKNIAVFKTYCVNQKGVRVLDGNAYVKPPKA